MSSEQTYRSHREMDALASEGATYVTVVSFIIAAVFAAFLLKNFPLGPALSQLNHQYVQGFVLAFYYACWPAGTKFDLTTQKWVYLTDPSKRHFPVNSILVVASLCLVALALFATKDQPRWFAIALLCLPIVNFIAWKHLLTRIAPVIRDTAAQCRDNTDYFGLERLQIVTYYISGRWQWRRFIGMLVIAASVLALAVLDDFRETIASVAAPQFGVPQESISQLLPDLGLIIFVVFAEGWIWLERAKTRLYIQVIDSLNDSYRLDPRPDKIEDLKSRWIDMEMVGRKATRRVIRSRIARKGRQHGQ